MVQVRGLSESEARDNISEATQSLLNVIKKYTLSVLTTAHVIYFVFESTLADKKPASLPSSLSPGCPVAPTSAPQTLNLLPAGKELLGIGCCSYMRGSNKPSVNGNRYWSLYSRNNCESCCKTLTLYIIVSAYQ